MEWNVAISATLWSTDASATDIMHNMQQNRHNHAKLLREFQFHIQSKIRRKKVSHKSATKIFGRPNIRRKIPLASQMAVKNSAGGLP